MTEISQRYARLADAFAAKIAAVPGDRWASPSPCEGWTARDVVRHVIDSQEMFLGMVGRTLGDIPSVEDDPLGAWTAARSVVLRDLENLENTERPSAQDVGFAGSTTLETAVEHFLCFDLVVHGWDLARATGLDDRIDPADVVRVWRQAETFGDALRGPQTFGPPVEPPSGTDEQGRLIAFLGRHP